VKPSHSDLPLDAGERGGIACIGRKTPCLSKRSHDLGERRVAHRAVILGEAARPLAGGLSRGSAGDGARTVAAEMIEQAGDVVAVDAVSRHHMFERRILLQ
jgi:hypothetical protein